ncbi:MAG: gluconate transporter, partial [Erythrobacter sp.]|nr:gluconate transporter [Erythrobacter sp.]
SGGAAALARAIIGDRPPRAASIAMGVVGLVIAIPVFFDVGLILLFPLVHALALKSGRPALFYGLPLLAGLAAAHAFIPPTPGPVAVAQMLGADLGLVMVCGLAAGVPAMLIAGPAYAHFADRRGWLASGEGEGEGEREGVGVGEGPYDRASAGVLAADIPAQMGPTDTALARRAVLAIAVPVGLIILAALTALWGPGDGAGEGSAGLGEWIAFIGHPFAALLIGCGLASWVLRPVDAAGRARLQDGLARAFEPTAVILLVTGAGGAFKQVLVDTGAGAMLAEGLLGFGLGPIVAGFLLAAMVRVAQGSATVAMLTAAGLAAPLALAAGLSAWDLAVMVIAIASGASVVSHVNDSGFWLVSRYFGISVGQTLASWTVASTLVGLTGFVIALILGAAV